MTSATEGLAPPDIVRELRGPVSGLTGGVVRRIVRERLNRSPTSAVRLFGGDADQNQIGVHAVVETAVLARRFPNGTVVRPTRTQGQR